MTWLRAIVAIAIIAAIVIFAGTVLKRPTGNRSRSGKETYQTPDPAIIEAKRAAAAGQSPTSSPLPKVELSEPARKAIFVEAVAAEARAADEGGAQTGSGSNPFSAGAVADPDRAAKQERKRKAKIKLLQDQYDDELAVRHKIGVAQLIEIVAEGRASNWPAAAAH